MEKKTLELPDKNNISILLKFTPDFHYKTGECPMPIPLLRKMFFKLLLESIVNPQNFLVGNEAVHLQYSKAITKQKRSRSEYVELFFEDALFASSYLAKQTDSPLSLSSRPFSQFYLYP